MARLSVHAKHVTEVRYFQRSWPSLDTDRWPGRELLWAWCHPMFTILVLPPVIIIDVSAILRIIGKFT